REGRSGQSDLEGRRGSRCIALSSGLSPYNRQSSRLRRRRMRPPRGARGQGRHVRPTSSFLVAPLRPSPPLLSLPLLLYAHLSLSLSLS
ncbi:unnamed protein product, partial [Musa acuminata subsp. burmannicoides]